MLIWCLQECAISDIDFTTDIERLDDRDKNWLVRSSWKILGPYSAREIAKLLLTKDISIIDEVRQPRGRWVSLRSHELFRDLELLVRKVQDQQSDHTATATVTHLSTKTDIVAPGHDELTPTPLTPSAVKKAPTTSKTFSPSITVSSSVRATEVSSASPSITSYGSAPEVLAENRGRKLARIFTGLSLFVLLALTGFFVWKSLNKEKVTAENRSRLLAEASRYRVTKLYEQSAAALRQAELIQPLSREEATPFADVLVLVDNQTLRGRTLLESVVTSSTASWAEKVRAYIVMGLSHLLEGEMVAARSQFEKALVLDSANVYARMNLAQIHWQENNPSLALRALAEIPLSGEELPARALLSSILIYEIRQADPAVVRNQLHLLSAAMEKSWRYRAELLLFKIGMLQILGDHQKTSEAVAEMLLVPPESSKLFAPSLQLYQRFSSWDVLIGFCQRISQNLSDLSLSRALWAYCLIANGRDTEARAVIREALATDRSNRALQTLEVTLFHRSGQIPEAFAALTVLNRLTPGRNHFQNGQVCYERNDYPCAEQMMFAVLSADPTNIHAIGLLAQVYQKVGRPSEAGVRIREGLDLDDGYLPLLELRTRREASGVNK
ncbi:MAG: tetratricopeptide repeat protein [Bdellovibrionaceae bacterium]|nr:tetratricopeptide repeat protein [Pseudobdellovibrionaceae bacterium]